MTAGIVPLPQFPFLSAPGPSGTVPPVLSDGAFLSFLLPDRSDRIQPSGLMITDQPPPPVSERALPIPTAGSAEVSPGSVDLPGQAPLAPLSIPSASQSLAGTAPDADLLTEAPGIDTPPPQQPRRQTSIAFKDEPDHPAPQQPAPMAAGQEHRASAPESGRDSIDNIAPGDGPSALRRAGNTNVPPSPTARMIEQIPVPEARHAARPHEEVRQMPTADESPPPASGPTPSATTEGMADAVTARDVAVDTAAYTALPPGPDGSPRAMTQQADAPLPRATRSGEAPAATHPFALSRDPLAPASAPVQPVTHAALSPTGTKAATSPPHPSDLAIKPALAPGSLPAAADSSFARSAPDGTDVLPPPQSRAAAQPVQGHKAFTTVRSVPPDPGAAGPSAAPAPERILPRAASIPAAISAEVPAPVVVPAMRGPQTLAATPEPFRQTIPPVATDGPKPGPTGATRIPRPETQPLPMTPGASSGPDRDLPPPATPAPVKASVTASARAASPLIQLQAVGAQDAPLPPSPPPALSLSASVDPVEISTLFSTPVAELPDMPTATSQAPTATPLPTRAEQVAAQVAAALSGSTAAPDRNGPLEIALDPPELGKLRISVSQGDDGLFLAVTVDRPETLDLMRRHAGLLTQEFQRQGLEHSGFSFTGRGGGEANHGTGSGAPERAVSDTPGLSTATPPLAATGLDIRI